MKDKKQEQKNGQNQQQEEGDGPQSIDKVLKENIEAVFLPLTEKYLNFKIVSTRVLDAKLQSTTEREADFLRIVKTDKGEEFILHLEFQSDNETDMVYRMKEYNAIIGQRQMKKHRGKKTGEHKRLDIRHYVIFLGKGKMTMRTRLPEKHVFREFNVLNLNELEFDKMLQSQIPEEIVLAILSDFSGKNPEKIIRLIIEKLKKYSNSDAHLKKCIRQLKVLSKLRTLDKETTKTINSMPIKYNLEEDYSYQQGIIMGEKRGIELGEKRGIELGEKRGIEKGEHLRMKLIQKAVIAMLMLGVTPEQIAEDLEVSLELVKEIQQKLN